MSPQDSGALTVRAPHPLTLRVVALSVFAPESRRPARGHFSLFADGLNSSVACSSDEDERDDPYADGTQRGAAASPNVSLPVAGEESRPCAADAARRGTEARRNPRPRPKNALL